MKRVGVRASSGFTGTSAPRLPELDGSPARLGGTTGEGTKKGVCSLCGATGHMAAQHVGGKAVIDSGPSGEAIRQNQASQDGWLSKSSQFTGNENYKSPGSEGGMS